MILTILMIRSPTVKGQTDDTTSSIERMRPLADFALWEKVFWPIVLVIIVVLAATSKGK